MEKNNGKEKRARELFAKEVQEEKANKGWKCNRNLLETSIDSLVMIGPDGIITDVNSATEKATGLPREKIIGTDFSEYFTDPDKARAGYKQVFDIGKVVDYELYLKHINGSSIPVSYNASVYKDNEGQIIGVLAVARDISAIKKYEDELIDFKNNLELVVQQKTAKLIIANKELVFQNEEKDKRAAELVLANRELIFQTGEKADRAAELVIADKELVFQIGEKADRAAELLIANKELAFQNEEKDKRAAELIIANKELVFQNKEKEKRATELIVANKELAFQNEEKDKRAAELVLANRELIFQTGEKADRAAELVIADKELAFQTGEKADRAAELIIANRELIHQNEEKDKRAAELKLSEEKYSNYIENAPDGIFVIDEKGHYIEVNRASAKMTGYSKDELLQMTISDSLTEESQEAGMNHFNNLLKKGSARGSLQHKHKDGTKIWLTFDAVKLTEHRFLGFAKDITYQKKAEEQILYISYHDQLTGLYNRRFYEEELKRLDTKRNLPLTIVMGDVNGLKLINDSFGHAMGDEHLRKAAEVIKNACRADDIIARLGGDEFVIILPKTDAFETEQIIKRIKDLSLKEKVGNIDISIAFGYATKSNEEENIQEIFKYAEDLMYRHKRSEKSGIRSKTIDLVMNTLYKKSSREQLHSIKVSEICEAIATKMDFSENDVYQIQIAGLMHDIGKIEIDEKILNKPEKLSKDEWERMQRHPEIGYRILSSVNEFSVIADDILEHHERWDGKGYPRGLKGEEISLHARIIAVADSYDSMTSDRTYSKALSEEEAINEIRRCSGTQFDPEVARVFIEKVLGQEWEQLNKI